MSSALENLLARDETDAPASEYSGSAISAEAAYLAFTTQTILPGWSAR
jgi:hypothetical protein